MEMRFPHACIDTACIWRNGSGSDDMRTEKEILVKEMEGEKEVGVLGGAFPLFQD